MDRAVTTHPSVLRAAIQLVCPSQGIELRPSWLARHLPLNALAERASRVVGFVSSLRKRS